MRGHDFYPCFTKWRLSRDKNHVRACVFSVFRTVKILNGYFLNTLIHSFQSFKFGSRPILMPDTSIPSMMTDPSICLYSSRCPWSLIQPYIFLKYRSPTCCPDAESSKRHSMGSSWCRLFSKVDTTITNFLNFKLKPLSQLWSTSLLHDDET